MTTVFHTWLYDKFIDTEQPQEKESSCIERIEAPIFLEAVLAIEKM